MKNKKLTIGFNTLLASLILMSCGADEKQVKREALPTVQVKTIEAQLTSMPGRYEFTASIASAEQAKLSTRIMGEITSLSVKEGEKVTKGQVIARIKSSDIEASKARIDANMNEAMAAKSNVEKNYNRIKKLYDKKSATQKEFDDISSALEMAKAKIASIEQMRKEVQANLGYAVITAPFTGHVTKKMMNEGSLATPGMPIVMIESQEDFEVKASVPASEIGIIKEGDGVKVLVGALGKELKGNIERVNPSGGYTGAQFEITIKLEENEALKELKSGLFAKVIIEKGATRKMVVPTEIILKRGQLEGFYTINHAGKAMLRWVRTGKEMGNQVEVLSGLDEGEQIIYSFEGKLQDGQKVEAIH